MDHEREDYAEGDPPQSGLPRLVVRRRWLLLLLLVVGSNAGAWLWHTSSPFPVAPARPGGDTDGSRRRGRKMRERLKRYANWLPRAGLLLVVVGQQTENRFAYWTGLALASPLLVVAAIGFAVYLPCLVLAAVAIVAGPPAIIVWRRLTGVRPSVPPSGPESDPAGPP